MKIKKNHFRIGDKKQYFIKFSEDTNLMINEIKAILEIFIEKNVKIYFTGFFRSNIPTTFKVFNLGTKSNLYAIDEINQVDYLFSKDFINSIVNLDFYLYRGNVESNPKFDINNHVVNLYLENCFTESGLFFDKNVYNEIEIVNKLKLI